MPYVYLSIAIVAEVIGTTALKASEQFTRFWPSLLVVAGYGVAFFLLSVTLKSLPVGVVYAIWSGMGIVLVGLAAAVLYREVPDWPAVAGMVLIVAGVAVINVFSKSVPH